MKTLTLLIALVLVPFSAMAQEPDAAEGSRIASTQVSGFDPDRLSPGLQRDIDALTGTPLDWGVVGALASRIEAERPDTVVATRALPVGDNEARVVFLVARLSDSQGLSTNINERYTIGSVEIDGDADNRLSATLRQDIQALVGSRLVRTDVDRLAERARAELAGFTVRTRITRGNRRGQLRVVFEIRRDEAPPLLRFVPNVSKFLYHSEQGWSGKLDLNMGSRRFRVTPLFAFDNADDLVEEYSAAGFRVEQRGVGTEHLGVGLELAHFWSDWREPTTLALVGRTDIPARYDERTTVAPSLQVGLSRNLQGSFGISVSELDRDLPALGSQMANAFTGSVSYQQRWELKDVSHRLAADGTLRASAASLNSDLDYTRFAFDVRYEYERGKTMLIASALAGHLTGNAPLFERFTLGDTTTLRGWDKYDIAPAGGTDTFHTSIEYRFHGVAFFFDAGSVWDAVTPSTVRTATGVGYHHENVFFTLGLPLNTDDLRAMVMFGVRF